MEKGMAAEPPLGTPHDLATHGNAIVVPGCVASFPAIVVRASGEVDCSRVRLDDCYRLATRLVQGEAAAAPRAEAAAAAAAAAPAPASSQFSSRRLADAGESSSSAPVAPAAAAAAAAAVSSVWPTVRIGPPWPAPPFTLACPRLTSSAQCEQLASDSGGGGGGGAAPSRRLNLPRCSRRCSWAASAAHTSRIVRRRASTLTLAVISATLLHRCCFASDAKMRDGSRLRLRA